MSRFFRTAAGRRFGPGRAAAGNPYVAAVALARRSPRTVMAIGGSGLAVLAIMGLLVLSSAQAFLAVSQSSNTQSRFSLNANLDLNPLAGGEGSTGPAAAPVVAAPGAAPTEPVIRDETTSVYGIRVHTSIAANLQALMDAATADGVTLAGWGWRDHQTQIRLRREHCGTSHYAIYEMPSSRCSPPTARPGRSQHEYGLAIDFTYNGKSISTRQNAGFRWLNQNAARYGFKNLASEPWHWSTTGR